MKAPSKVFCGNLAITVTGTGPPGLAGAPQSSVMAISDGDGWDGGVSFTTNASLAPPGVACKVAAGKSDEEVVPVT